MISRLDDDEWAWRSGILWNWRSMRFLSFCTAEMEMSIVGNILEWKPVVTIVGLVWNKLLSISGKTLIFNRESWCKYRHAIKKKKRLCYETLTTMNLIQFNIFKPKVYEKYFVVMWRYFWSWFRTEVEDYSLWKYKME